MGTSRLSEDTAQVVVVNPRQSTELETKNSKSATAATIAAAAAGAQASPLYDIDLLPLIPPSHELELRFDNVNGWVPGRFNPPTIWEQIGASAKRIKGDSQARSTGPRKQILYNISGGVRPGEVLALMGPSGSGKTSLLTVLAGRRPKMMDVTGTMLFNGKPLVKETKRRIGYVLQDDLLYESLTVYETLEFAALLRLPSEMPRAEKVGRVDVVLAALGLQKCRDTIIGGHARRGVSGGERKRVSVGHELLINPSMIMLDEPTSGLDSTTAMHLISLLRALAGGNRAVLTTIHQPSSRLYQQLDKLMLLSQGHVMYYGAASQVATWFSTLGFPVPFGVNVADFILDLAMGEAVSTDGAVTGTQAIRSMYHTYEQFSFRTQGAGYDKGHQGGHLQLLVVPHEAADTDGGTMTHGAGGSGKDLTALDGKGMEAEHATASSSADGGSAGPAHDANDIEKGVLGITLGNDSSSEEAGGEDVTTDGPVDVPKRGGASYPEQIGVLLVRCSKVRRFEAYSTEVIAQTLVISLLCGLFWFQRGGDTVAQSADSIGLLFFTLLFPALRATFSALFTFPGDFRMLLKERSSGMYRLSAFYIARTASDFPMDLVLPTIFFTIAYFMGGLRYDGGVFMSSLCSVLLLVLVAQSFGLLIGGAVMDAKTAQTIVTIVIMCFMLVAGFYVRNIPVWISWCKYLSFIYWSYNLLMKIQFAGVELLDCSVSPCLVVPSSAVSTALNLTVDINKPVYPEVLVLFGMLIVLRTVIYFTLRYKTSQ